MFGVNWNYGLAQDKLGKNKEMSKSTDCLYSAESNYFNFDQDLYQNLSKITSKFNQNFIKIHQKKLHQTVYISNCINIIKISSKYFNNIIKI